ncbi:hypothetical protein ACR79M_04410 [Sphingobacterium spiritivorum]|uniref:hypothetical protein n=1 Tax=Sphingobacterium TaxID=28453 RepID=UPI0025FAA2CF|nr:MULTISPECIES: hypothetical protein [unclassified Sphingobacterium]
MRHYTYDINYTLLLTDEEIRNPFTVLDDVFGDTSSCFRMQEHLWDLVTVAMRPHYWARYDSPLKICNLYKSILRLIEAGWLISLVRPEQEIRASLSDKFMAKQTDPKRPVIKSLEQHALPNAYKIVLQSYREDKLFSVRIDLFEFLFEGLHPTCVEYSPSLNEYLVDRYHYLSRLIDALYIIHDQEKRRECSAEDLLILEKYQQDDTAGIRQIHIYQHQLTDMFTYSEKEDLQHALSSSYKVLYHNDFWKYHHDPANVLHYFHDFIFIIDSAYVFLQHSISSNTDPELEWNIPAHILQEITLQTVKEGKKPLKYLSEMFGTRTRKEWREELMKWEEAVLSNKKVPYEQKSIYKEVQQFLAGLLEFITLLPYAPKG